MYRIAVDIGGTFTDCAILGPGGRLAAAKGFSVPEDPARGVVDALQRAAEEMKRPLPDLLRDADLFVHGCTIGTNAMIERTGVRTGLLITRGHEHTLRIGRVLQKVAGLSEAEMIHASRLHKAEPPLVPPDLVRGVTERLDWSGEVLVPLDREEASRHVEALVAGGVKAVAVCFLWSFLNPDHERQIRDLIRARHPDLFVTLSSDLSPVLGEYERAVTTTLNAYLGPRMAGYLERLEAGLRELGYVRPLLVMQAGGGLTTTSDAAVRPVVTLDSGPVGGTLGARYFGGLAGQTNIICTDVGGTSFDVSLIHAGELQLEQEPVIGQYTFRVPKVLVKSIGAGGGSIAWVDEAGLLRVGPRSARALPGPACYGHGGAEPTVTDADLVLGYLSPESFLGGRMRLDVAAARAALERLGARLDGHGRTGTPGAQEVAAGIVAILNAQMADLIRKSTVDRGFDPRDFVLVAYGGAGPTHAAFYGADVDARALVIFAQSTVFSAFGMLTTGVKHTADRSCPLRTPLAEADHARARSALEELEEAVLAQFAAEGAPPADVSLRRSAFVRYQMQVHALEIELPPGPFDPSGAAALFAAFEKKYAGIYGAGTGFAEAGLEVVSFRVEGAQAAFALRLAEETAAGEDPGPALVGRRPAYFEASGGFASTAVFRGDRLRPGHLLRGPALVERMGDTVVIPPGHRGRVDGFGNLWLDREGAA